MLFPPRRRLPGAPPSVLQPAQELADFNAVRAHWEENFMQRFGPAEPARVLMARVLDQIRVDGHVLRESYVFPLGEVTTDSGEATRAEQAYCALNQLNAVCFAFELPAQRLYYPRHLLDSAREQVSGYTSTSVTVLFNPQLRDYLLNVARLDEPLLPA